MSGSDPSRLGTFNFAEALALPLNDRLDLCVRRVGRRHSRSGYADLCDIPAVPTAGATEDELAALERGLGVELPAEYRAFLGRWRYLDIGTGLAVWGFDHQGVFPGRPWVSETHPVPGKFLVFGHCWRFADGDQIMFQLDASDRPVVLYLHEERPPAVEPFAPTFSLALWWLVHEED